MASNASQRARRPPGPAVDDEVVGVLGDLRIEVVHEHPERGFLLPAAAAAARCRGARGRVGAPGRCSYREPIGAALRPEPGGDTLAQALGPTEVTETRTSPSRCAW